MTCWRCDRPTVEVNVVMPAFLSFSGQERQEAKSIDACIAPIVRALNECGYLTANSCCGHGEAPGSIVLHDRRLIALPQRTSCLDMDDSRTNEPPAVTQEVGP